MRRSSGGEEARCWRPIDGWLGLERRDCGKKKKIRALAGDLVWVPGGGPVMEELTEFMGARANQRQEFDPRAIFMTGRASPWLTHKSELLEAI